MNVQVLGKTNTCRALVAQRKHKVDRWFFEEISGHMLLVPKEQELSDGIPLLGGSTNY